MRIAGPAALMLAASVAAHAAARPDYPPAPPVDHVDMLHGVAVPDPYRWLEDMDAPATRRWVQAQQALTRSVLDALPERAGFERLLGEIWRRPWQGVPRRVGRRRFFVAGDPDREQPRLMVQVGDAPPRVLIDPNRWSDDGTAAMTQWAVSPDGRHVAWALARAGSDWNEIRVRSVDDGRDLPEVLGRVKFSSIAWTRDGKGFFYSRYPDPPAQGDGGVFDALANQALYYHRIGTPQAEDRLVLAVPEQPRWGFVAQVSDDGRWLLVSVWRGSDSANRLYVKDLGSGPAPRLDAPWIRLVDRFDAAWVPVGSDGDRLILRTDDGAPRGRIVAVDMAAPGGPAIRELVPQSRAVLEHALLAHDQIVAVYLEDAVHRIRRYTRDGRRLPDIPLPGLGRIGSYGSSVSTNLSGRAGDPMLYFAYSDFSHPLTVYRADLRGGRVAKVFAPPLDFDPDDYVTRQVFFTSRDGTRVPMFIAHRRGLEIGPHTPTLLHGYGGFEVSLSPWFSEPYFAWMQAGGVFAVANLRGGGEYGKAWHEAGIRERKTNVFDDFIAAAGWLIHHGITDPKRLAITGRSNGGLLMGAVVNRRPDLFAAVVADVGVMDMLRFHRFTIGWAWTGDYGSPEDPEQFRTLLSYSPYHNIRPGTVYPAVMATTGDHDDRVVPLHSYKYVARLQAAQAGDAPILLRVDIGAGHAGGKPVGMRIAEHADRLAFLWHHAGGDPDAVRRAARMAKPGAGVLQEQGS